MVKQQCSECGVEFEFPLFTPSPGKGIRCINCEDSPLRLQVWSKATKDEAQKREILKRLAALKLKPGQRKRF